MRSFFRRMTQFFLAGFIVTFVIYLFVKIGIDDVIWGLAVGAIGGVVTCIAVSMLERRFPDQTPTQSDR